MGRKGESGSHPPKVPLTVRVGVTGHRDVADNQPLRSAIRKVLSEVSRIAHSLASGELKGYVEGAPVLRLISPLAEGADRIAAFAALELGFDLRCPLPFTIDEYKKDFKLVASKEQFDQLIQSTNRDGVLQVLQLDGNPSERQKAYRSVGRTMLVQSDLVIAIWDGQKEQGEGGTAEIVHSALALALPVVWIHSRQPDRIELLTGKEDAPEILDLSQLESRLQVIFGLPKMPEAKSSSQSDGAAAALNGYFRETRPRLNLGDAYDFLYSLVRGKPRLPRPVVEDFEKSTKKEWSSRLPPSVQGFVDKGFRAHFAWADNLARYYAGLSRSSTVGNYLMGAAVVWTAYIGVAHHSIPNAWAELVLLAAILLLTWWGRHRRWHERWLDYRTLAEALRLMQFAAPLAQVPPSFRVPPHMERGDPRTNWANWYFRSMVRYTGMAPTTFEPSYLSNCRDLLIWFARDSQARYHRNTAERANRVHERLHILGLGIFGLAVAGCITHLIWSDVQDPTFVLLVGFIVVVLPAFGAAIAAIRHHAELERVSFRSHALEARFKTIVKDLEVGEDANSTFLAEQFHRIAETFQAELVDWRYVFLDKNLVLP